jgi:hypothetical protein
MAPARLNGYSRKVCRGLFQAPGSLPHSLSASLDMDARSRVIGAKSVAQPHDIAAIERDYIKAAHGQRAAPCHQIVLRRKHQAPLLVRTDTRRGRRELPATPRADLDEHKRPLTSDLSHHEIDLPTPTREIARDKPQALPLQVLQRALLKRASDCLRHTAP